MWKCVLVLLAVSASVSALKCVQCSTKDAPECMDPMNETDIKRNTVACASRQLCRKITFTENGKSHVNRDCAEIAKDDKVGCSWEIRVNSKIGSGWDCFCDEDVCNSAPAAAVSGLLLLLAAALTAAQ
ncbi:hypothetical protein FJT64_019590 [Amphibalanus amphitrite]|uniref:UPAR/Ly6 domain-containing protein qvr n=1 Tax=Amphibalanus amphitrite TaxID=1232801 RepID=A0A6A4WZS7_AMPAM|nr:hypothetical protein FJT64_019590 [Amphibalanus amphitrite]